MMAERLERMKEIGRCGRLRERSFVTAKPDMRCRFDFIPASNRQHREVHESAPEELQTASIRFPRLLVLVTEQITSDGEPEIWLAAPRRVVDCRRVEVLQGK